MRELTMEEIDCVSGGDGSPVCTTDGVCVCPAGTTAQTTTTTINGQVYVDISCKNN